MKVPTFDEVMSQMPKVTWDWFHAGKPVALRHILSVLPQVEDVPGLFAEIGTFRGTSARFTATVYPNRTIHCFDTWKGIARSVKGEYEEGNYSARLEDAKKFLAGCKVEFHPGVFPDTFNLWNEKFAFVYSDTDTYYGTKTSIETFLPRMSKGGIIVVDDVDHPAAPLIRKALEDLGVLFEFDRSSLHATIRA